jgi:hypothetical protein
VESKKDTTKSADLLTQTDTTKTQVSRKDTTAKKVTRRDTTKAQVNFNPSDSTVFAKDTIQDVHEDQSALDIGSSRGIFILSSNGMLQLRISGSVRANFNYSDQNLTDNNTFNPYYIPTDVDVQSPNFFAGIQQTRLSFEVTRKTEKNDIFIRLEGDFKNNSTSFRVRHAYGQIGFLLIGQTWSLMNNVSYQPAIVSMDAAVGGSGLRTPQIRYTKSFDNKRMQWSGAIEYSSPSISIPDSLDASLLQVIPDFSARYSHFTDFISFRVAVVITTLSGRVNSGDISYSFGYFASFSGKMKLNDKSQLYLTYNLGRATSHLLDVFSGNNEDLVYNANTQSFESLVTNSGFIAYNHDLPKNFSTSLALGIASITNKDFQPDDAYSYSYNTLLNLFWTPVDGARLGIEYAFGQRFDHGDIRGRAYRISMLMYYDF